MEREPGSEEQHHSTSTPPAKTNYVARWREDEHVREIRLVTEDLYGFDQAGNGEPMQLEQAVCKRAIAHGWLLGGEDLHFVSVEQIHVTASDSNQILLFNTPCVVLNFAYCPAADPKQRTQNLRLRHPDWVEVDYNRRLTFVGVFTLVLVILQFGLLLQQNVQFDDALRQFKTVVDNYVWQVNAPMLWPSYLPDSNEIELVNYGQTPIRISSVSLITHGPTDLEGNPTVTYSLLAGGPLDLTEGKPTRVPIFPNGVGGMDIRYGVRLEVRYVYFGNRYQLIWPAIVQFKNDSVLIVPQGEPMVELIHTNSPTLTPVGPSN